MASPSQKGAPVAGSDGANRRTVTQRAIEQIKAKIAAGELAPGQRLPTEVEWETGAAGAAVAGNLMEGEKFHPQAADGASKLEQVYGDVWEWTASAYLPYPGFAPLPGALGEYNGKFMCSQMVLRGGSVATPASHIRATYRNFFPPAARWQMTGARLARDSPH